MISIDTEDTGIDFRHGSRPFFTTTCNKEGEQSFWEWSVDPITRVPEIPKEDVEEIRQTIQDADEIVMQNGKFDCTALSTIGIENWPWQKTHDTLIAGHLLASNQPHDLTSMALVYLGINIKPLEEALKLAVNEARRIARSHHPEWLIAKSGDPNMPSIRGGASGCDYWLPRAVAIADDYPPDHPWWTVLRDYSNTDSAVTLPLFLQQRELLRERGLWTIYLERMKCLPVAHKMECHGVTLSKQRLDELRTEYSEESVKAGRVCINTAKSLGYDLELPKTGNNKSLLQFCFGRPREASAKGIGPKIPDYLDDSGEPIVDHFLNLPIVGKTDSGKPSLDKVAMGEYAPFNQRSGEPREFIQGALEIGSLRHAFIVNLGDKRKRDTALQYLDGYERFMLPLEDSDEWFVMHPSLNPTGTDTLRWSSSNPNEQNISKQEGFNLRYAFGPAPGREWWSLDYQNIELRIPAYESGEQKMIDLFEKPDDPPYFGSYHLLNASIVYPDLFWPLAEQEGAFKKKYNATWYHRCKCGGFAIQYGCQEKKADQTFQKAGSYRMIKEKMPKVAELNEKYVAMANRLGYVETLPDKNVCPERGYPILCSRSMWGGISPTVPFNFHIQSTAMWATMKAMIRVADHFDRQFPEARIALQVHDELVIDLPFKAKRGNIPRVRKVAQLMRESGKDIEIPLTVGISYHPKNWGEEENFAS